MKNFEVSFNSPQCGWMSVGFKNSENEFNSTTSYTPHTQALSELLKVLVRLLKSEDFSQTIQWSRNPEDFEFFFQKKDDQVVFAIYEYPTDDRLDREEKQVFAHDGEILEFRKAFYQTFSQLYEDRNTDEFEQNWHQPFPFAEFEELTKSLK